MFKQPELPYALSDLSPVLSEEEHLNSIMEYMRKHTSTI